MSGAAAPAPAAGRENIPWFGLAAVIMGTFISILTGRLSSIGIADIRGALHAGFDEGAWITTAQPAAQLLVTPLAVWIGTVYGPRRILLRAACAFAVISLILPLAPNLSDFLALQFMGGLASGFFIPLTLGFIIRSMPPRYWVWGIAIYALSLDFSLNVAASLEAWYVDYLNWHWIFWQNVPLAIIMAAFLHFGVPPLPRPPNPPPPDWFGFSAGGIGLALIYGALDQGNRLDWLNSGVIVGLLLGGGILLAAFLAHEATSPHPAVNFKVLLNGPLPRLLVLVSFLRMTLLATLVLVPDFLQVVRGFRSEEIGQTLIWIAIPQFIFCPLAALMLRRSDARLVAVIGFIFISTACLIVAHTLTPEWGTDQFVPTQFLQAIGQSFALSGIIFYAILHLTPADALTFGSGLQVARQLGGEIGLAFVVTFTRVRSQVASNLIGQHVQAGSAQVLDRLHLYAAAVGRGDIGVSAGRAVVVLAQQVHSAATIQGIIDTFIVLGFLTALALVFVLMQGPAPSGPASPPPLLRRSQESSA
jgi:DHA2 family multidrug resistance protein